MRILYKLSLVLMFALACSCTRKQDGISKLQISFGGNSSSSSKLSPYSIPGEVISQSVSAQNLDPVAWNESLNPTASAQVNCVMVAVGGPEPEMRRNRCWNTTRNFYLGKWVGGIPVNFSAGSSVPVSIEVPSGPQRQIFIVGFKSVNGACRDFKIQEMDENNLSHPIILGSTTQDLSPGDVSVNLGATVTAASEKIDNCEGPDFGTGPRPLYFGDASDGDKVLTGGDSFIGTTIAGAHAKIISLNATPVAPNDDTIEVSVGSVASFSNFQVNDEVMIIVNGGRLGTPPGHADLSACGYKAHPGIYAFGRLKAKVAGSPNKLFVHKGTFLDKLHYDPPSQTYMNAFWADLNTKLAATPDNSSNFCYMQIVRVPHFNNLTLNPTGVMTAEPFNYDIYGGGIIAFRVNGTLTFQEDSGINANNAGFKKISARTGAGILGNANESCSGGTPTSSTHNGGTCSVNTDGGGGGGHGVLSNTPIMSLHSGGFGGGNSNAGGFAVGDDCNSPSCYGSLNNKMFMGGAGGSTAVALGGNGGGIIYIAARNVLTESASNSNTTAAMIGAAGESGGTATASGGGGGGGAGGSIYFGYQTLNMTESVNLNIIAVAGSGGTNAPPGLAGGGAGGGRVQIMSCSGSMPTATLVTGNGGGNSGQNGLFYVPPATPVCF